MKSGHIVIPCHNIDINYTVVSLDKLQNGYYFAIISSLIDLSADTPYYCSHLIPSHGPEIVERSMQRNYSMIPDNLRRGPPRPSPMDRVTLSYTEWFYKNGNTFTNPIEAGDNTNGEERESHRQERVGDDVLGVISVLTITI